MINLSTDSIKSLSCLICLPILLYLANKVDLGPSGQVTFWLLGLGLVIGCFLFLGKLLTSHDKGWSFLLPGALLLCLAGLAIIFGLLFSSDPHSGNGPITFAIALGILGIGFALFYNIKGVGVGDGVVVTLIQSCFAILVVGIIAYKMFILPNGRRRRIS